MPLSPRRDGAVPGSPSRSPRMAARSKNKNFSLSDSGSSESHQNSGKAHAHVHHHHHQHESVPHANLILAATLISTLVFFFIYFLLTIPLEAPKYPSSSDAGLHSNGNESASRLLDASETM